MPSWTSLYQYSNQESSYDNDEHTSVRNGHPVLAKRKELEELISQLLICPVYVFCF